LQDLFLVAIGGFLGWALLAVDWQAAGKVVSSIEISKADPSQYLTRKTLNYLLFLDVLLGLVSLDKYLFRRFRAL
jgi:hypothetical protein